MVGEADGPRELQLVLQGASHLLRVEHVAENPDLGPLSLDVGVARGQPSTAHRPTHSLPHLLNIPGRPTVVLTDDPLDPLLEVEPVDGHHVTEVLGERLGLPQQDPPLLEYAPGASHWRASNADTASIRRRPGGLWLAAARQHGGGKPLRPQGGEFLRFLELGFSRVGTFPGTSFSRFVSSTLSRARPALGPAADDGGRSGGSDGQRAASS